MMMNVRIVVKDENYIVVISDSKRFGMDAVMFEGNSFDQCFDYIKKETGAKEVHMTAYLTDGYYKDREGRTFPNYMKVI